MIAYPSEAKRQSVVFTELLITLSLVFTFFVAHGQFGTFSLQQSFLKHFVAVFLISASAMEYFGYRLFSHDLDESKRLNTGSYWLCLCLLGVFIVCGSVYARSELKIQDTFFINGLYILVGFAFSLTLRRNNLDRLINTVFWITLVFAIIVCVASIYARIVDLKVNETFIHEREFLVIPLIYVVVFGRVVRGWLRSLMLFLVIAAAGAALKNTPMIVLGLTLLMSYWRWWTYWWRRTASRGRGTDPDRSELCQRDEAISFNLAPGEFYAVPGRCPARVILRGREGSSGVSSPSRAT